MKKEVEELIHILSKEEEKTELPREIVKGELRSMIKGSMEEVALMERAEAKNGFYSHDIEGLSGQ